MLAHPLISDPYYLQASAPSVKFLDCARVSKQGQHVCVASSCYDHVLVTTEISPLVPGDAAQIKFHAPSVGIVQIESINDPEAETLSLVKLRHLSQVEMALVRGQVCEFDKRGHRLNDVYRNTAPARAGKLLCSGKAAAM